MAGKDYQEGIYRDGKFMPYEQFGQYRARLDPNSNKDARASAERGKVIHGSFKDGVFRPAERSNRPGFMHNIILPSGDKYGIDHTGVFYDSHNRKVGEVNADGLINYKKPQSDSSRTSDKDYSKEGNLNNQAEDSLDVRQTNGRVDTIYRSNELTGLANFLHKSNRVLGRLGAKERGYDLTKGSNLKIYEGKIPGANLQTRAHTAYTTETADGKYRVVVIDSRLKPYEKLAAMAHELAHVAQGHKVGSNPRDEREAQTRAIQHLTTLYNDYEDLQKATKHLGNKAFFDINQLSKKDITKAIGFLMDTRGYFGVDNKDLEEHVPVLRRVARDLEGMVAGIVGFLGLFAGLFFLSTNVTGNVIGNMTNSTTDILGVVLFVLGVIGAFFYFRNKQK